MKKKIKIVAESVRYRGGKASRGDIIEIPAESADYFIAHGYAEAFVAPAPEVGKAPVAKKAAKKNAGKKKVSKKKVDDVD